MNSQEFEEKHVTQVYNQIAKSFSRTRSHEWPQVSKFISSFFKNSLIGDIGCGNGRFMLSRTDVMFEGCDNSLEMVNICKVRGLNVQQSDITKLPFNTNYFDGVICIAVLHHLSTEFRRIQAIQELIRIMKSNGKLLIEVWSYEASFGSRFENKFEQITNRTVQDKFLAWNSKDTKTINNKQRYYHLFTKDEIVDLIQINKNVIIEECFLNHGNWFIIVAKK